MVWHVNSCCLKIDAAFVARLPDFANKRVPTAFLQSKNLCVLVYFYATFILKMNLVRVLGNCNSRFAVYSMKRY